MRRTLAIAVVAAGLGLGVGVLIGRRTIEDPPAPVAADDHRPAAASGPALPPPKKDAPTPKVVDEGRLIPRSSIYCANWRREGLRMPRREGDEEFTATWERLRKRLATVAYRTAFVVQVPTIYGAVEDTLDVLDGRRGSAEGFLLSQEMGRKSVWAALFLGNLPGATDVTFTSATFSANELTVTVRVPPDEVEITGYAPNLYWVPLPEVRPGVLTLRLHDSETKTDLLVVRTDIEE